MSEESDPGRRWERWRAPALGIAAVLVVSAVVLLAMGRTPWCACGEPAIASWDTWSMHNSQHLLDAYTFSHVLHGVLFFPLVWLVLRGPRARWRLPAALGLEAAWEVLENTPMIIERYRETTISLDYYGDSVANSLSDIVACGVGFGIAASVPWWGSVLFFLGTEALLLWWIKDSLILNVVMLVWPLEAIKAWQSGGG